MELLKPVKSKFDEPQRKLSQSRKILTLKYLRIIYLEFCNNSIFFLKIDHAAHKFEKSNHSDSR